MAPQRRQSIQSSFDRSCHEFIHVASQVRSDDLEPVDAEPENEELRCDIPERDTQSHESRTLKLGVYLGTPCTSCKQHLR